MRKPFYKKSHGAWYVHHEGRVIRLGPEKDDALLRYHELKASAAPATSSDSVASLLNSYLQWCQKNRAEHTYQWYREFLSSFTRFIGIRQSIGGLKPFHVTNWLDANEWSNTTRHNAVKAVKRAFNWAVKDGRLNQSPIRNVERPAPERREAFLTSSEFQMVLEQVPDTNFRDYLNFMFETGVRPEEARQIETRHCQLEVHRIVLPRKKAKGKQFPRVIYLTDKAVTLVARLCEQQSDGPLLRNLNGRPWTKDSVNCRFRRIREKLAVSGQSIDGLCATTIRHGFATEALKNGVDPVTVSILMGHSDASQVARTYQHLAADATFLSQAVRRVRGQGD